MQRLHWQSMVLFHFWARQESPTLINHASDGFCRCVQAGQELRRAMPMNVDFEPER
jgi:hypothetical protein